MVEYGLLVALIAIVAIVAVALVGNAVSTNFSDVATAL
jgi:Flp pilus assembly pilin Flp